MYEALAMGVADGRGELLHEAQPPWHRQLVLVPDQPVVETLRVVLLLDDQGRPELVLIKVGGRQDAGVMDARGGLELALGRATD